MSKLNCCVEFSFNSWHNKQNKTQQVGDTVKELPRYYKQFEMKLFY